MSRLFPRFFFVSYKKQKNRQNNRKKFDSYIFGEKKQGLYTLPQFCFTISSSRATQLSFKYILKHYMTSQKSIYTFTNLIRISGEKKQGLYTLPQFYFTISFSRATHSLNIYIKTLHDKSIIDIYFYHQRIYMLLLFAPQKNIHSICIRSYIAVQKMALIYNSMAVQNIYNTL